MFKPDSTSVTEKLTFSSGTIMKQIKEDLEKQGYVIKTAVWNESRTKLEVEAVKKGGK